MERRFCGIALVLLFTIPCPLPGQVKAPSLRDEVRQHGGAWRITYHDDLLLATFDQLINQSDFIIRGRVVDEHTRLSPDEKSVLTDYTIEVLEIFKDPGNVLKIGDKLVVSKWGGNVVAEGKPVRVDTPKFPPIPWVQPHVFFIARWRGAAPAGEYLFVGSEIGVVPIEHGQIVCNTRERSGHPISKPFCGKTEVEFLQVLKEKITATNTPQPHP